MSIKKTIARDNRICFIFNQAAEECCLPTFSFCLSMMLMESVSHSVISGGLHLGGGHTLHVAAYVPEKGKWDTTVEVVVDGNEETVQRVKLASLIDAIQEIKDKLASTVEQ